MKIESTRVSRIPIAQSPDLNNAIIRECNQKADGGFHLAASFMLGSGQDQNLVLIFQKEQE